MTQQIDPVAQAGLVRREVRVGSRGDQPTKIIVAARSYPTDREDLWDAVTNAERIPRWFLPISGDLEVGGRYQLQGHAGGRIERCDAPSGFAVTWEAMDQLTWLQVRLTETDDGTQLELTHELPVDPHWEQFGPGAVGVGWDMLLIGLELHLASGGAAVDPAEFQAWSASQDGVAFVITSSQAWTEAYIAGGGDPDHARASGQATTTAYTTPPEDAPAS